MGRPLRNPDDPHTSARVLDAAAAVFARHGYAAARLEDIASDVGITRPSLLYHFDSKRSLYEAVVRDTFARLGAALAPSMAPTGPFRARVETLARAYVGFLSANPDRARIVVREIVEDDGAGNQILREQVAPLLEAVVRFLGHDGAAHVRRGLPLRAAVMQLAADGLLRNAAGGLRGVLWGPVDPEVDWLVAKTLVLAEAP